VGQKTTVEVARGITRVGRERADAARLLELARGHGGIENSLHYVRDVTPGEDACGVRTGSAPQVLAALRNVVVHLLGGAAAASKAAAARRFAARPFDALSLLLT
jgi:hypothetical protein